MQIFLSTAALALASLVTAQKSITYLESTSMITYKIGIQENTTVPYQIYAQSVSPINNTYSAISFGGCMLRSPIAVVWPNNGSFIASSKWADAYNPPSTYPNATLSVINKASGMNATHWWASIICTGCSHWLGGSVPGGQAVLGFGVANRTIALPGSANSSIPFHNVAKGHMELDLSKAKNSASDWAMLVMGM